MKQEPARSRHGVPLFANYMFFVCVGGQRFNSAADGVAFDDASLFLLGISLYLYTY